jgi:hypothetical protein
MMSLGSLVGDFRVHEVETYKTLEPGPYWPDTGHAHTTCNPLLVAFEVAASLMTRVFSNEGEGSTGMTSGLPREDGFRIKSG